MATESPTITIDEQARALDAPGSQLGFNAFGVGALALVATFLLGLLGSEGMLQRVMYAYLVSWAFFLTIALGALFFVILQHLTRAGWSVVVRRTAELLAAPLPLLAVLAVPLVVPALFGSTVLYPWADAAYMQDDPMLRHKSTYLSGWFVTLRVAVYVGTWALLARWFLQRSVEQDQSGDPKLTERMETRAAPAMIAFAVTLTFASFDLIMSLDPHWFSTMFGVYFFAGAAVAFFAALPITLAALRHRGRLTEAVSTEHLHDLGKLLFAFVFFWAYIAYSQYMLIWYANIPDETRWFLVRQEGAWASMSLALVIGHFALPFVVLMSRHTKRRAQVLVGAAVLLLVMHYLDLYWVIMPVLSPERVPFHVVDLACLLGVGGLFVWGVLRAARGVALAPVRDPRLGESLAFENF